ncbi:MAG: glycosyltransferase, partial [Candidatus Aureabacteria bacterium]|nr:glycosyltransferase [Candidatus Auribacterota bacterium]
IDAAARIPVQIVMEAVGADTQEYEDRMRKKVAGKKNIVWIHENLGDLKNRELYSGARVFVCPSVYEPFGIINLEAMACEIPVVASAVGGILEVVVPGETGLLVKAGQADQIARAVNALLRDPDRSREMGRKGRKRVEDHFSWESIAQKTKAMYESLCRGGKAGEKSG